MSVLTRAVHVVFAEWTALGMAVENEWGGRASRDKALGLLSQVLNGLLTSEAVHADEIEDLLDSVRPPAQALPRPHRLKSCTHRRNRRCWTSSTLRQRTTAQPRSRGCCASCMLRCAAQAPPARVLLLLHAAHTPLLGRRRVQAARRPRSRSW